MGRARLEPTMSEPTSSDSIESRSVDGLWREVHDQVRRQVGTADRADDVVQEAFLHALRRPPPDQRGLSAWLKVVARHVAIRSELGERNRREREHEIARARSAHALQDGDPPIDVRAALQRLDALEDPYRQVLRMRYLDGREIAEIARVLGYPETTVRSQIKRGLDRIRERLGLSSPRRKLLALAPLDWLRSRLLARPARALALLGAVVVCVVATLLVRGSSRRAVPARIGSTATVASAAPLDLGPALRPPERVVTEALPASATTPPPVDEWEWSFEGRVLDASGRPASSAEIRIVGRGSEETCTLSDEAGRFRIVGADGRRCVWAQREGQLPSPRHLVASIDPTRELVLELG